jgi:SAM-dependent methyltransferase
VIAMSRRSASAQGYDEGWRGQMHHQTADRTADLAPTCVPAPGRILDAGCRTGYSLGRLAACLPQAEVSAGIDAAPAMIAVARSAAADDRSLHYRRSADRPDCVAVAMRRGSPAVSGAPSAVAFTVSLALLRAARTLAFPLTQPRSRTGESLRHNPGTPHM